MGGRVTNSGIVEGPKDAEVPTDSLKTCITWMLLLLQQLQSSIKHGAAGNLPLLIPLPKSCLFGACLCKYIQTTDLFF